MDLCVLLRASASARLDTRPIVLDGSDRTNVALVSSLARSVVAPGVIGLCDFSTSGTHQLLYTQFPPPVQCWESC